MDNTELHGFNWRGKKGKILLQEEGKEGEGRGKRGERGGGMERCQRSNGQTGKRANGQTIRELNNSYFVILYLLFVFLKKLICYLLFVVIFLICWFVCWWLAWLFVKSRLSLPSKSHCSSSYYFYTAWCPLLRLYDCSEYTRFTKYEQTSSRIYLVKD